MEHGRHTSKPPADPSKPRVRIRIAAWLTVLAAAAAGAAQAQDRAPASASCVSKIAAVLADIAARDLDTTEGPPLNAFLALNPNALAQTEALDRGEQRGPLLCVPIAVKDNFDTYDMPTTDGRFDTSGIFPIGFVNGVPGVIARDTTALRAALAVAGDGWRVDADGDLRGRRIGILRRFDRKDPWAPADADAQELFAQAIARMRQAGAEIVEGVAFDEFDARLGPEFLKGFAPRVDAAFATFPAARRDWRDVCTSGRIRPEWRRGVRRAAPISRVSTSRGRTSFGCGSAGAPFIRGAGRSSASSRPTDSAP